MFKKIKNWFITALNELNNVNYYDFNRFIFSNILANALKFNTILPIMVAMGVVAFSLAMQGGYYIFIPQSSITAFASYVIFACVSSILVLVIYPMVIIIILNYLAYKSKTFLKNIIFPIKLIVLICAFFICIEVLTSVNFRLIAKLYVTGLWTLFYFLLINLYITYTNNNGKIKFSKAKIVSTLVFCGLLIKPFLIMFIFTSQMINYTSINAQLYMSQTNCDLITTPIGSKNHSDNMAVNDPKYYIATPSGCKVLNNTIRYGFGGDYVLIFKKNIHPIINSKNTGYNSYVRLTCYSGNCYAQDNIFTESNKDSQSNLIERDMARKQRKIKNID